MSKIVHFGKYYLPDAGGIESVSASLARGTARKGHDVTVVCFKKAPAADREVLDRVRVIRAPLTCGIASQPLGLGYFTTCVREGRKADVVHLHAPNMLGALCALLIGKKPRLLVHWHSDVINKGMLGWLSRPLERALLGRADCIVATSEVYAEASHALKPFRHKVRTVPIGVPDVNRQRATTGRSPLPAALAARLEGKKIILAVGRLVPYKGFDVLIQAATHLPGDTAVVIVGGGPLLEPLAEAIDAAGVADRVSLTGRLNDGALHELFLRASLYCLPSTYRAEAFGVVLLEAMAYGLPIVASDIPGSGVPWVNKHGVSGVNVPVGDPETLAKACLDLLQSEPARVRFAAGARDRFVTEFTEEVSLAKMLATYQQMGKA